MFCIHCGYKNKDDSRFCVKCGKPLTASAPSNAGAVGGQYVQPTPEPGALGVLNASNGRQTTPAQSFSPFPQLQRRVALLRQSTGKTYELDRLPATIGKGSAATVRIDGNNAISRTHVRIAEVDGILMVEELGATNNTYLNGKYLLKGETAPLASGDELQLADERFVVNIR